MDNSKGLHEALTENLEWPDALQVSDVEGLSVLTCGTTPDNPAELLALPDFNQLLSILREEYDFVLVDSPPMAPVSDSAIIASLVDRVILAMTLSKNARAAATSGHESLIAHGADVMGLVVSKYGGSNSSYGYANGYGYGGQSAKRYETSPYYTYS